MKPCKFTFDDEKQYDGFAHGSSWNGFDNVAVTKATLDQIIADCRDPDTADSFREIEPTADGLYSLGWGFATQVVKPPSLDDLIHEYKVWNAEQGLDLGSANEHLFDDNLSDEQRQWLRSFCYRWEVACREEDAQAAIECREYEENLSRDR
jgi:hypothetical protein